MQVHPDVARLRGDVAPQPVCDAAVAAWRSMPEVAAVRVALARLDEGEPLMDMPALRALLHDHAAARDFVAGFLAPMMAALRTQPLAHLPFGHSGGPGMARLRLIEQGRCCLTLTAMARRERQVSPSALFEDGIAHEIVVAGEGAALRHRLVDQAVVTETVKLLPGVRMTRSGPDAARQISAITQPLLLLQVTKAALHPAPSREIAVDDGRLIQTISGCKRTSQQMMALGVIGTLGHHAGINLMAALARDGARPRDLRWEALRQVLAMDALQGLALLAELAGDVADVLNEPAATLQRQLTAARPDLAALLPEPALCR
jgi:hypothetical protein